MVALVVCTGCVHPFASPVTRETVAATATRAELPQRFVVVSWNAHKFRHREAAAELQRFTVDADLVLLQEAIGIPATADHAWGMVEAFRAVRGGGPRGVATGSVATPSDHHGVLSDTREPLTRTPKSALLTTIPLGAEQALVVVNLHAINFRRASALRDQLVAVEPGIVDHDGPVIVAGDFNTWSRARRAAVEAFAARCDLQRVFSGPDAPRLDAVFVRGLVVENARVVHTRASDHDALRVELAVAPTVSPAD